MCSSDLLSTATNFRYRKWGAVIANANAGLRLKRLEAIGLNGRGAHAWGGRDGDGVGFAGVDALDDLRADVGGGHGPGF